MSYTPDEQKFGLVIPEALESIKKVRTVVAERVAHPTEWHFAHLKEIVQMDHRLAELELELRLLDETTA